MPTHEESHLAHLSDHDKHPIFVTLHQEVRLYSIQRPSQSEGRDGKR